MAQTIQIAIDARKAEDGAQRIVISLDLVADTAKKTGDKSSDSMDKFGRAIDRTDQDAKKLVTSLKKLNAVKILKNGAIAVAAFLVSVKLLAGQIDEVGKSASRLNVDATFYQTLVFAADQSGVSVEALNTALKDLQLRVGQAAAGNATVAQGFTDLGIEIRDSAGNVKSAEVLFGEAQIALQGIENGSERAAAGQKIFGESVAQINNIIKPGTKTLTAFGLQLDELGGTLNSNVLKASADVTDQFGIMSAAITGKLAVALTNLAPTILAVLTLITDLVTSLIAGADAILRWTGLSKNLGAAITENISTPAEAAATRMFNLTRSLGVVQDQLLLAKDADIIDPKRVELLTNKVEGLKNQILDIALAAGTGTGTSPIGTTDDTTDSSEGTEKQLTEREAMFARFRETDAINNKISIATKLNDEALAAEILAGNNAFYLNKKINDEAIARIAKEELDAEDVQKEKDRLEILAGNNAFFENKKVNDAAIADIERTKNAKEQAEARKKLEFSTAKKLVGSFSDVANAFKNESAGAFKAAKAFSIATSLMNTYEAVTKAFAQGGVIGYITGAAILVSGLAQVANIAKTQPGGGSSGGGGSVGSNPINDNANPFGNPILASQDTNVQPRIVNVSIYGFTNKESVRNDVLPALRDLLDNDDEILFDTNSRQSGLVLGGT